MSSQPVPSSSRDHQGLLSAPWPLQVALLGAASVKLNLPLFQFAHLSAPMLIASCSAQKLVPHHCTLAPLVFVYSDQ